MNARTFSALVVVLVLAAFPVAAATPTVDGQDTGDWAGVGISAIDPNEVGITDTVDIHYVYLTCDSSNMYLRFDAWATPVGWSNQEEFWANFDTDQSSATGCNDTHGHVGTGYERRVFIQQPVVGPPTIYSQRCNTTAVPPVWDVTTIVPEGTVGVGNVFEASFPIGGASNLGFPCNTPLDFFIFFDNKTTEPDDNIPDSGNETLVELASFIARPFGSAVQVQWVTASEIDNAGFNLYRREADETGWTKLNGALIPATGGPTWPAEYEFIDDGVSMGVKYYYLLEDVDIYGTSTEHGPVWVTLPLGPGTTSSVD